MRLKLIEKCWGINRRTGEKRMEQTDEKVVDASVGCIIHMPKGRRVFQIDAVNEDFICVSVIYENNPKANKTFEIEKGENIIYRPKSLDGGYQYILSYEE